MSMHIHDVSKVGGMCGGDTSFVCFIFKPTPLFITCGSVAYLEEDWNQVFYTEPVYHVVVDLLVRG